MCDSEKAFPAPPCTTTPIVSGVEGGRDLGVFGKYKGVTLPKKENISLQNCEKKERNLSCMTQKKLFPPLRATTTDCFGRGWKKRGRFVILENIKEGLPKKEKLI